MMLSHADANPATLSIMMKSHADLQRATLRRFMRERKLKVLPWCTAAGVLEGSLRNFLAGRSKSLSIATLERLAAAQNVPVDLLLGHKRAAAAVDVTIVPVLSTVQAGDWEASVDAYAIGQGFAETVADVSVGRNAFALDVVGDSMLPEFRPGDRIIVDPGREALPGDFVVAKRQSEDEATFKKLTIPRIDRKGRKVIELVPLNPAYPTMPLDRDGDRVIGPVVEHHRYWRADPRRQRHQ